MPRYWLINNHRWRHSYITLHYLTFSFEISSPCTKINSRTRLYNAAASPASRLRSAGSLAISPSYMISRTLKYCQNITVQIYEINIAVHKKKTIGRAIPRDTGKEQLEKGCTTGILKFAIFQFLGKWRMVIAVNFQFKQLERRSLKKSGLQRDSNPWPPRYRCSAMLYQPSYEATHWERGQFIEFISFRAVTWCEVYMK